MNTLKKTTRKIFNKKNTIKLILAFVVIIVAILTLSFTTGSRLKNTVDGSSETKISETQSDNDLISLNTYAKDTTKFEELKTEFEDIVSPLETTVVEAAVDEDTTPKTYTTVANDSYYKLAEKLLGDGKYCYAFAEYNGANGNYSLTIGKVLNIPNIEDEEFKKLYEETNKKLEQQKAEARKQQVTTKSNGANTTTTIAKSSTPAPVVKTSSGVRNNPGEVDTSGYTYLGKKKITGYTPGCSHCCGNSNGITASGTKAQSGRTIAAKGLAFGTVVYIKGYGYYTVEDRGGFNAGTIDMAASSHEECYSITSSGVDCWIVQ